jgi:DNA repair protein RadA/Sms
VEIQTLVVPSGYGIAQRITTGYDAKRLQMLLAVLERRLHLDFAHTDVFLNVAGGLVVRDPGVDLAVCVALVSSLRGTPLSSDVITIGEVSLTGELHIVTGMDVRLNEAEKLGFRLAIVPTSSQGLYAKGVEITPVPNLSTAIEMLVK